MVVNVGFLPLPLPLRLIPRLVGHQIINLDIALSDILFLQALVVILISLLLVHFLFVCILVIDSVVEILVI